MQHDFLQELLASGDSDFEHSKLFSYSQLARLSYQELAEGFEVICDHHERLIGQRRGRQAWLGFRGSRSDPKHWLGGTGNCDAWPRRDGVFQGFQKAIETCLADLMAYCQGCDEIHFTGHSRGAALATLAGWYAAKHFRNAQVNVVVFGSPRVGLASFAEGYRQQANLQWAGFQHLQDVVGRLPPWGEHIYPPTDPLTDFKTPPASLLQSIPQLGKLLNVMWVFGSICTPLG